MEGRVRTRSVCALLRPRVPVVRAQKGGLVLPSDADYIATGNRRVHDRAPRGRGRKGRSSSAPIAGQGVQIGRRALLFSGPNRRIPRPDPHAHRRAAPTAAACSAGPPSGGNGVLNHRRSQGP